MSQDTHIGIGKISKTPLNEAPRADARGASYARASLSNKISALKRQHEGEKETVSLLSETFNQVPLSRPETAEEEGQLSIDVFQNQAEIVLISGIAGTKKEDLEINLTEETLTIKGQRLLPLKAKNYDALTSECFWGRFSRHIILPKAIDRNGITAKIKDHILIITIPKTDFNHTKIIKIS